MSRISTYPIDSNVNVNDYIIGTDSDNNSITKNYTISSIVALSPNGGMAYINAAVAVDATTLTPIAEVDTFYSLEGTLVTSVSEVWAVGTGDDVNKIIYSGTASQVTNIMSTVNIKGASASSIVKIALFKNTTEIAGTRQSILINASNTYLASVCLQTINTVATDDIISVKIMNTSNTDSITAAHFNLSATLV
jgi:hypothetical protein